MDNVDNMMSDLDDSRIEAPKVEQDTTSTTPAPTQTYTKNNDKAFDPWEDFDDLQPKAIDVKSLKRFTRNAVIVSFGDLPDNIDEKLSTILPKLQEAGFTLRLSGDTRDKLEEKVAPKYSSKEYHLPWKKFNTNITGETSKPTKFAYQIAKGIHKGLPKVSNSVRAMVARNTHMMLGKNCDDAAKILIAYTKDGAENKRSSDYKTTGTVSYFIEVAELIGTPVFNLHKDDCVERLTQYLTALQG